RDVVEAVHARSARERDRAESELRCVHLRTAEAFGTVAPGAGVPQGALEGDATAGPRVLHKKRLRPGPVGRSPFRDAHGEPGRNPLSEVVRQQRWVGVTDRAGRLVGT